jgi:hypothetical protein
VADAIWLGVPYYGVAGLTADGLLCTSFDVPLNAAAAASTISVTGAGDVLFCFTTQRLVFGNASPVQLSTPMIRCGRLLTPRGFTAHHIPSGSRISALHADS